MRHIRLRNAFFRGWFAARAERRPPQPDSAAEAAYIDDGFKAGERSGGHALPMIGNHRPWTLPDDVPLLNEPRLSAGLADSTADDRHPDPRGAGPAVNDPGATDLDLDLTSMADEVPELTDRAGQRDAHDDDVPLLNDAVDEPEPAPALKRKPASASRFWQD
jgi:hypothetical protein